ncbi:hypothetical protein FQR65_LT00885 [Abscondita terminalis]|nr:hypothetical protein FQR65_LT00885 [Abscondita terminalis]
MPLSLFKSKLKSKSSAKCFNTTTALLTLSEAEIFKRKMEKQNWFIPDDLCLLTKVVRTSKTEIERPKQKNKCVAPYLNKTDTTRKVSVALQSPDDLTDLINKFNPILNYVWNLFLIRLRKSLSDIQEIKKVHTLATGCSSSLIQGRNEEYIASCASIHNQANVSIHQCSTYYNDTNNFNPLSLLNKKDDIQKKQKSHFLTKMFLKRFKNKVLEVNEVKEKSIICGKKQKLPLHVEIFLWSALTVACVGLHYKSITGLKDTDFISAGAFCGFLVILIGLFAGHLMGTPVNRRIEIFFCLVGCALFVAAGALNIDYFDDYRKGEYRNYGLAKASLAIINGALFLIDSLLTWRGE